MPNQYSAWAFLFIPNVAACYLKQLIYSVKTFMDPGDTG